MMHARKLKAKSAAANIMTLFSEYLVKAPPATSLEINDEALKIPTSTPISLSSDPNPAR
jgi:hypothetical protein